MSRKISYINGRPVITITKTVTEEIQLPDWLANSGNLPSLMAGLVEADLPFMLKSPGTPNRKGALDRWRLTVYGDETRQVESLSTDGVAKAAHGALAGVGTPAVTLKASIQEVAEAAPATLEAAVAEVEADAEAVLDEVKALEKSVEDDWEDQPLFTVDPDMNGDEF